MTLIRTLFTKWNTFPVNSQDHQRANVINALLLLMILSLLVFSVLDIFKFNLVTVAATNFSASVFSAIVFIYFRRTLRITAASNLTVLIMIMVVSFAIIQQAPRFNIFIWISAVPLVAFYLAGVKRGYWISLIYGLMLAAFLWYKCFVLDPDFLRTEGLANIFIAYTCLVLFVAHFERSRERAFRLLLIDIEKRKQVENEIVRLNAELEVKVDQRTHQLKEINDKLKEAAIRNKKLHLEALEANRVKSEFLSRMSHKLRTPLNSILGFSQLLTMSPLDQKQLKNVERIHRSGKSLLKLVDDILEINTIDNIRLKVFPNEISLGLIIRESIDKYSDLIKEKNLTIIADGPKLETMYLRTDKQLMQKIVEILLHNAIKFNKEKGEIKIEVKKELNADPPENSIRLSVIDTGIGIKSEELPGIFDLFLVPDAGIQQEENTGLGLTMAKKIVEKLGGSIGAESQPGIGSHFWIVIPVDIDQRPTNGK